MQRASRRSCRQACIVAGLLACCSPARRLYAPPEPRSPPPARPFHKQMRRREGAQAQSTNSYGALLDGVVREVRLSGGDTAYAVHALLSAAGYSAPAQALRGMKDRLQASGGALTTVKVDGADVAVLNRAAFSNLLAILNAPAQRLVESLSARLAAAEGEEEEEEEEEEARPLAADDAFAASLQAEETETEAEEEEAEDEEDVDAPPRSGGKPRARAGDRRRLPAPPSETLQLCAEFIARQFRNARRAAWRHLYRPNPDWDAISPHWKLVNNKVFWGVMGGPRVSPPVPFKLTTAKGTVIDMPMDGSFLLQLYRLEHDLLQDDQLEKAERQGRIALEGIFRSRGQKYGGLPLMLTLGQEQRGASHSAIQQLAAASPAFVSAKTVAEELVRAEQQQQRTIDELLQRVVFILYIDNFFRQFGCVRRCCCEQSMGGWMPAVVSRCLPADAFACTQRQHCLPRD